ncbi:MAG: radical SAM protein [Candidatus Aenigmatarchaeota archaeon]
MTGKRVLFLTPPVSGKNVPDRVFGCNYSVFFQHNIFMLYPATLLQQKGFDVKVTDCVVENKTLKEAMDFCPDVCVFYSVFLSIENDLATASRISEANPGAKFVFMGSGPSAYPNRYLRGSNYFVVRGEPEYTLLDLMRNIDRADKSAVRGISWKRKGKVVHNGMRPLITNIDRLPIPDRTLLEDSRKYYNAKFRKLPSTTMLTSRNCSFKCYYCVPNSLSFARELEWKRFHRGKPPVAKRSPENIISEFREIARQGYRSVFILDDQFVWGKERTIGIMEGIKGFGLEIALLARPDMLKDEEIVRAMKEAGVTHVDMGIESFRQEILDYIGKGLDVETIDVAIGNLKKYGIDPEINVLFGSCPLETKETMKDTMEKVEKLGVEIVHIAICTPFPGTEFRKRAIREGWLSEKGPYRPIDPALDSLIEYPHLTKNDLRHAVKTLYFKHYYGKKYLARQLMRIRSPREFAQKLKTAINIRKKFS